MEAMALEAETGAPIPSWIDEETRAPLLDTQDEQGEDEETSAPDAAEASSGTVPYVFHWSNDETGNGALTTATNLLQKASGYAPSGVGDTLKKVGSAVASGAALGASIGSFIPGIGTAIGGAVGSVVGAVGSFFSSIFGPKKPKSLAPWQVEVMEKARKRLHENPFYGVDAVLMLGGRIDYRRAKAEGKLPSQIYARNKAAAERKAQSLKNHYAAEIEKRLEGISEGEKILIRTALLTGHGKEALTAVKRIRARLEREKAEPARAPRRPRLHIPSLPAAPPAASAPVSVRTVPVEEASPPPSRPPSLGEGMEPASLPTLDTLPRPAWHVAQSPMPESVFLNLLRTVPALQALPRRTLEMMAGLGSKARDVAGVDATSREYVMLPGETLAGIAEQLTGNPERALELAAANPARDPKSVRLALPPGFLSFVDMQVPAASITDDTGAPDGVRQNRTARVWEVHQNEFPLKIAKTAGAEKADPQWWKTLKSVNDHKALQGGGANFAQLIAGELLNYPDTWPAHPRAVPAPGASQGSLPSPVPTVPAAGTLDPGSIHKAQGILAVFTFRHPEAARPADFGRSLSDTSGTMTERTTQALQSFQAWWNRRTTVRSMQGAPSAPLRTDGILDPPTDAALMAYATEEALGSASSTPVPSQPSTVPGIPNSVPSVPGVPIAVPQPGAMTPGPGGAMTPAQLPGLPGVPPLSGPPATPIPIPPMFPPGVPIGPLPPGPGGAMTPSQLPGLPGVPPLAGPPATPLPSGPIFSPGVPVPAGPRASSSSGTSSTADDNGGFVALAIPAVGAVASMLFR